MVTLGSIKQPGNPIKNEMKEKVVRSTYQEPYATQFGYVRYHGHLLEYLFLHSENRG
jgi:hypothetical protein